MGDWNLIEMLANFMGNAPNTASRQIRDEFAGGSGGQGYMRSAQASPMQPQQPSTTGPMGGPLQSADTIGHEVPPASLGRGEDFMRALKRGLGGYAPSLPAAGERQQMFADIPRPGYDPTQRRY
jgi:hypothetical protein